MDSQTLMRDVVVPAIQIAVFLGVVLGFVAYMQLIERKLLAFMQLRLSPRRVGWHGILQPIADTVKLIIKEDTIPAGADRFLFTLAPILTVAPAILGLAVIPVAGAPITVLGWEIKPYIADLNIAVVFLLAIGSLGIYGIILGGWASNSKYSLLGALRSSAQMVSYEVPLGFALIGVMMLAGSASLVKIVEAQKAAGWWFVFPQVLGFFCYFVSALAETNRIPFDLPEAEAELVAGFHTEYSGMKFALFFMAEYTNMFLVSCLATVAFLGGWLRPFPNLEAFAWLENGWLLVVPVVGAGFAGWLLDQRFGSGLRCMFIGGVLGGLVGFALGVADVGGLASMAIPQLSGAFWFSMKVMLIFFLYIWFRGTYPRYRYDQLMNLGWKWLLPLSIANVIVTAVVMLLRGGTA
ncbi:MAG TPA: complex I subunit 1 family protein [Patescibacteria group bacterium]|nr:complex I subunit 1 family protein [Patescibacteria group bacterium]